MVANENCIHGLEGQGPPAPQTTEQNMQRDGNHEGNRERFGK